MTPTRCPTVLSTLAPNVEDAVMPRANDHGVDGPRDHP